MTNTTRAAKIEALARHDQRRGAWATYDAGTLRADDFDYAQLEAIRLNSLVVAERVLLSLGEIE